jgi:hypothetical protein
MWLSILEVYSFSHPCVEKLPALKKLLSNIQPIFAQSFVQAWQCGFMLQ